MLMIYFKEMDFCFNDLQKNAFQLLQLKKFISEKKNPMTKHPRAKSKNFGNM
jgi:hypothetical protein